jgi:hypothetical protein
LGYVLNETSCTAKNFRLLTQMMGTCWRDKRKSYTVWLATRWKTGARFPAGAGIRSYHHVQTRSVAQWASCKMFAGSEGGLSPPLGAVVKNT